MLHHGQGKWYPGEQLPRWAFALYWRGDGQPLWRNPSLIAEENPPVGASLEQAEKFAYRLTERLGIDTDYVLPAFEDPAHFMLKEHMLPENLDPSDNKLEDVQERKRLARVFDRGLDVPSGFVLPVQRWQSRDRAYWRSERWATRRGKLRLIPGDSPVGYRLPLGSLPYVEPGDMLHVYPLDPFAARAALLAEDGALRDGELVRHAGQLGQLSFREPFEQRRAPERLELRVLRAPPHALQCREVEDCGP